MGMVTSTGSGDGGDGLFAEGNGGRGSSGGDDGDT